MTSTLTRPSPAVADETTADAGRPSVPPAGTWLTTGDHKRLGLLFLLGGAAAVLATCLSSIVYFLGEGAAVWTSSDSRLAAVNAAAGLLVGIPALWIGIATYVVPLQIGATRLALPRLHNLSLWTMAVGGVLLTIGFVSRDETVHSLASSVPAAADGPAADATELVIVGLILVVLGIALAGVSLLVTVLSRRADGLRLTFLPLFSWSALATSTVLVLAAPVLLAGLVLLFFDHHYGSTLLSGGGAGSRRVWQHELWILGQPFGLLFAASAVGIFCDVVATHARRPLVAFPVARIAAVAAPLLTLLLWLGNTSVLASPFAPVATAGAVAVGLPLGLGLLTWLATLKSGTPRAHPSLLFVILFLATVALVTMLCVAAVVVGVTGDDAEAFRNGQITMLTFGAPLLALGAAAVHWSPKLWGRATPVGPAALQALLLFGGPALLASPGYLIGLGAGDGVFVLGIGGAVVTAAGVLLFAVGLAGRGASSEADPYGGLTLEWATASPPPPHNFEEIPDVRSAHPLFDAAEADAEATR